mgnify:CR=1 FL=1
MGYFEDQEILSEKMSKPEQQGTGYVQQSPVAPVTEHVETFEDLCRKYADQGMRGKMYIVTTNLSQDDDMDRTMEFLFSEPKAASYDRYVKTASVSSSKAMRTFVLDNICQEQRKDLEMLLNEFPAMGISLGEKLLYMLGLSKTTTVRRL